MRRWADELLGAFQFLTRLPISRIPYQPEFLSRSAKFFPVVGLVIGLGVSVLWHLLTPHLNRVLVALLILTFLVLITGGLHEDGLADSADAFGGGWSREQILSILRDSRVRKEIAFLLQEATQAPVAAVGHAGFIRLALTTRGKVAEREAWDQTKDYGSVVALEIFPVKPNRK